MNHRIFNMHTDVNASDCVWGCTDTVRESALNVDLGEKNLATPGNRTCIGNVPVQRSDQLSFIPTPKIWNALHSLFLLFLGYF